jgi:hypothetical protein
MTTKAKRARKPRKAKKFDPFAILLNVRAWASDDLPEEHDAKLRSVQELLSEITDMIEVEIAVRGLRCSHRWEVLVDDAEFCVGCGAIQLTPLPRPSATIIPFRRGVKLA